MHFNVAITISNIMKQMYDIKVQDKIASIENCLRVKRLIFLEIATRKNYGNKCAWDKITESRFSVMAFVFTFN